MKVDESRRSDGSANTLASDTSLGQRKRYRAKSSMAEAENSGSRMEGKLEILGMLIGGPRGIPASLAGVQCRHTKGIYQLMILQ